MTECGAVIRDHTGTTVSCGGAPGHRDDHKRGFLRWANDGSWYTVHYHPRFSGDRSVGCPACRDEVYDLAEHMTTCKEAPGTA